MNAVMDRVLADVAGETMMNLAFLLSAEDGGDGPYAEGDAASVIDPVTVIVGFSGPRKGNLRLVVARRLLAPLAVNMLGLEPGEAPAIEQQVDALKEMANVVCGNLLPAVDDPQSVFNVLGPEVWQVLPPPAATKAPAASAFLRLEEGEVFIELHIE
jgi:CheY-specific phosphatase CheX